VFVVDGRVEVIARVQWTSSICKHLSDSLPPSVASVSVSSSWFWVSLPTRISLGKMLTKIFDTLSGSSAWSLGYLMNIMLILSPFYLLRVAGRIPPSVATSIPSNNQSHPHLQYVPTILTWRIHA
jgi:hypothetical protein